MAKVFSYNFPTAAQAPNPLTLTPFTGQSFSTMSQYLSNSALTQAFRMWSNVVDVSYQSGSSAINNISIAYWNVTSNGAATSYGVGSNFNTATNFWFFLNKNYGQIVTAPTVANWGVWTLAHELGHTMLGTGHPIENTNDLRMSIMYYPTTINQTGALGNTIILPDPSVKIPLTPGMTDISFLQNGATNPFNGKVIAPLGVSHASDGADTYSFTNTSINFTASTATATQGGPLSVTGAPGNYVMTIWDSAGTDKIDASGMTTSNYINLNGGQFSSIGSNKNIAPTGAIGSVGYGTEYNVGIAIGALIENATGGSAADTIVGNALANTILAGGGNDTIIGSAGSDTIYGQAGADVFKYLIKSDGADTIRDFSLGDKIDLSLIDFNPALAGVQHVTFTQLSFVGTANGIPINFLSADYNGDNLSDFSLTLTGVTSVSTSDFILI